MELVRSDAVDNQVKSQVSLALHALSDWLAAQQPADPLWLANYRLAQDEISNWFNNNASQTLLTAPLRMPPGAPI
jgi:hypothetical protein